MQIDLCGLPYFFSRNKIEDRLLPAGSARWYRKLQAALLLLFVFTMIAASLQAQEKDSYLFQDSSVMNQVEEPVSVTDTASKATRNDEEEAEDAVVADTILVSNELRISTDSVRALKISKPFAYAKILDSLLKGLKTRREVKYTVKEDKPSGIDLFFASGLTQAILWSLAVGMLLFILVKLFFSGGIFQRQSTSNKVKVIAEEEQPLPDVNEYSRLIKQAISAKDFRLATRYLYLQSLQQLIDRGVVTYGADKTNYEYLSEMSANPKRQAFAALTLKYEYVWYGGFVIDENTFAGIQQLFNQFNNEL